MSPANMVLGEAQQWMAAVYLVTLGAQLAETYKDVDIVEVPSEGYGDAHVLYDVGVGAATWRASRTPLSSARRRRRC